MSAAIPTNTESALIQQGAGRRCQVIVLDAHLQLALGQPGVSFLMAIIVGAIAGWLAEKITASNMGLLSNIVMGVIGGFLPSVRAARMEIVDALRAG